MTIQTKQEFMDRLKAAISGLSDQEQGDILNDYEEHFRIGLENGRSEAEIAGSLGSPEELGASFVEESENKVEAIPGPDWDNEPQAAPRQESDDCQQGTAPAGGYYYAQPPYQSGGYEQPQPGASPQNGYYQGPPQGRAYDTQGYGAPSAYPPGAYSNRTPGERALYTVLVVLLSVFIVAPCLFGIIGGVGGALLGLTFAGGLMTGILFAMASFSAGFILLGIAAVAFTLLCVCGAIGFIYGIGKLIGAYCRLCGRIINGNGGY